MLKDLKEDVENIKKIMNEKTEISIKKKTKKKKIQKQKSTITKRKNSS